MKNVSTVMNKEFARFFGDKRMMIMIVIPAVLIYVIYSFMGTALESMFSPDEDHTPTAYVVNMPASISPLVQAAGMDVRNIGIGEVEEVRAKISRKEAELCVVFPADFDRLVDEYDAQTSTGPAPNIEMFFNSTEPNSSDAYSRMYMLLDYYESLLANKFDINREVDKPDQATAEDMSAGFISMLMPMLLMLFLYSGCIGLAPESIAGEKERGTLATLLVTPIKRSELAVGKILSLAVLSFLSGLIMAIATIVSLPKIVAGGEDVIDAGIYGFRDYLYLALVILSTILLMVAVISIVSAFAKTVKEANTAVMPLMIVVMLVGVSGMIGSGSQLDPIYYIIPMYGSVQSMSGIFSLDYSAINIILASVSSIVYACAGGFVLTRMFNNEKIMFAR